MSPPKLLVQSESDSSFEINGHILDYDQMREDLQTSLVGDDGEESEEDDDVGDPEMLATFFLSLIKVQRRDLSIRDKDVTLFESKEDKKKDQKKQKKNKEPMYLKDVQAKQLLEEGPGDDSGGGKAKSLVEKQQSLRKALCDAVEAAEAENDEDDEQLLRETERNGVDDMEGKKKDLVKLGMSISARMLFLMRRRSC